jgi:ABC-type multidrug transport system fused ATPase/permease subunit
LANQKAEEDYMSHQPRFVKAQESTSMIETTVQQKQRETFITREQAESFGTEDDDDKIITTKQNVNILQNGPKPPPPPLNGEHKQNVQHEDGKEFTPSEQEWIVPQRYSNPYGLPAPKISPDPSEHDTIQEEYLQSQYYRQQMPSRIHQQPQMPPRQLAPRDYNFNRIPPRQQYHEHSLVVRNTQYQQRQGFGKALLQKIGKSLDVLADADTVVSKQAQKLVSSVPSISESLAGNISGAVRGTVFEVINRGTGIKEAMKDTVRGSVSTMFGGAPTIASETQDEWEQDRRKTVTETRRRSLLGTSSGETYSGTGTSPLQEHLNMLMEEQNQQEKNYSENTPDGNGEEYELGTNNNINGDGYSEDRHFHANALENTGDDNVDWTQNTDNGVDPQTFFQTRAPVSSHARESSNYTDEEKDNAKGFTTNTRKIFHLRMKPRRLSFFRKTHNSFSEAGWGDEDDDIQDEIIKKPSIKSSNLNIEKKITRDFENLLSRQQNASPLALKGTVNLLSSKDLLYLSKVGRSKAMLDLVSIVFLFAAVCEALKYISFSSVLTGSFPDSVPELIESAKLFLPSADLFGLLQSWFPHAVTASILTSFTRNLLYVKRVERAINEISEGVKSSVIESQLRLRILTGLTITRQFMDICGMAAAKQAEAVIKISRARHFVFLSMITILFATVSVVRPMCEQILNSILAFISLDTLHMWPIDWSKSFAEIQFIFTSMFTGLYTLTKKEWILITENPIAAISTVTLVAVLLIFSQLPGIYKALTSVTPSKLPAGLEMNTRDQEIDLFQKISDIGKSSATRLAMLLNEGNTDAIMITWKQLRTSSRGINLNILNRRISFHLKMAYTSLCWILALVPVAVEIFVKINHTSILNWKHMIASMFLLNITRLNARNALLSTIASARYNVVLEPSLSLFAQLISDIDKSKSNIGDERALSTSISNAGGLVVRDLWVAHVSKRSWACRGISFECKPGEVILILGDDGCGKSRLLTSLCELIVAPSNRARTTNYARGSVTVGGLDIRTWHRGSLKRKLGIFLQGTKSTSDLSEFYSGSLLGDILKPSSSSDVDEGAIRSSMDLAMQFTSLSTALIPRLEKRLSSVILSNEDGISSMDDSVLLSHSDWSKVLLTKAISQSIFNNDNPMAPNNTLKNCLLGSILFLDDITSNMNEVEELTLINALKGSGASTLMTSSKWAVGRHVDKIIVLKNGSIVESGTHDDLLSRGSNVSLYAQRWSQMRG